MQKGIIIPPLHIIVVEDNTDARELFVELLTILGHFVQQSATGANALELISSQHFQLALIDLGLPDLDGLELARKLRRLEKPPYLAALTGYDDEQTRSAAQLAGFDGYLVKPVDGARLEALLHRVALGARPPTT